MAFVVAAYLITAALFAGYALTLAARQRVIADLAEAAADAAGLAREPQGPWESRAAR